METNLIITPKTKVLQLIEAYPNLEEVLINYVPAFSKLKNPLLRKTVAKIATLQQAAAVGNVKVEDLVNLLRKEVGQDLTNISENDLQYNITPPDWLSVTQIIETIDIKPILDAGEQPVSIVISSLNKLSENEILLIQAPFLPAPLIDKALSLGFSHFIKNENKDLFLIYFKRAN